MRKFLTAALAAVMSVVMAVPAFAGWQQDPEGWRYYKTKDTYLTSQYTEDGYWVDVNGIWDGNASIGDKQEDGSFATYEDPLAIYPILGTRIFKATNAVMSEDKKVYTVTADIYDTAFMTNDEIKQIKKGDTVEIPGLNLVCTAVNKATRGVIITSSSKNPEKKNNSQNSDKGYRVRLQDADGNQYILSSSRLRKTSEDSSTTETVLRPVASGVTIIVPTWRDSSRVNGTSHYSTTKTLMEKGMFFEATLKNGEAQSVTDVTYNYDTTNAPVYDEQAAHGHLYNINEY